MELIRPLCVKLRSETAGPVAAGLAAIALDSVMTAAERTGNATELEVVEASSAVQCDLAGGIIGATGGLAADLGEGGPEAILIAAVTGAAVGSTAHCAAQAVFS